MEREVWQEDLAWALELRDKQRQIQASRGHQCDHRDNFDTQDIVLREPAGGELGEWDSEESGENKPATFNSIPINYVLMREWKWLRIIDYSSEEKMFSSNW